MCPRVESDEERKRKQARERTKRWKERHPEYAERRRQLYREMDPDRKAARLAKAREDRRRRFTTDRETILARNREWYWRNRERRSAYNRNYRKANLEAIRSQDRERNRARYAADPAAHQAYLKEWRKKNPQRAHAYLRASDNKRRRAAGLQNFTAAGWLALLAEYNGLCAYDGSDKLVEADHRTPLARGGSNTIENILPACRRCNRRKHLMTEDEVRAFLGQERHQGVEGEGLGERRDGNAGTTSS